MCLKGIIYVGIPFEKTVSGEAEDGISGKRTGKKQYGTEITMEKKIIRPEMIREFKDYLINDEKSRATIEKYLRDVVRFAERMSWGEIDRGQVIMYKGELERDYAVRSANSMIAALNAFFRFMNWQELNIKQFKVQKEVYRSDGKELSQNEYRALVRAAENRGDKRLALIVETICATGIRVSELKYITVEAVKTGEAVVSCKGKKRKIFIVDALRRKLLGYAKNKDLKRGMIFVTRYGNAPDRSNIWRAMKKLCDVAGVAVEKVFPHNLRHLFARVFYKIEKDISSLADVLGHSNINTTRIYIISTGEEHRQRMESMRLII